MDAEKSPGTNRYWIGIAIVLLAVFIVMLYVLPGMQAAKPQPPKEEAQITLDQFKATLQGASLISVVQDLRNVPDAESKQAVQSCSVNLASSLGTIGKNVSNYAYSDGDICFTYTGAEKTVSECEQEINKTYALIVTYGTASTTLYRDHASIATNKYYGGNCALSFETIEETANITLPEVNPNATANVANLTAAQIFENCAPAYLCANMTEAEQYNECLYTIAYSTDKNAACCFGISSATRKDECIFDTADRGRHGKNEDYCQFVQTPKDRDFCYFIYGVSLIYPPYCEKIGNATEKDTCNSEALARAATALGAE
ncbi:MAG: hypothetical protein Q7T16_05235 [Candidatus Burarchaeum sp.]|nr:hypothetical protein [Candidatus Burarchaeum sp.]MDO8340033.1 hypothetical protein [Candidatus Burarchaeum sp.]